MLFLTKYESNLIVHGLCNQITFKLQRGGARGLLNMKIFVVTKFLLTFMAGQTSMGRVRNKWGSNNYYYNTTLSFL